VKLKRFAFMLAVVGLGTGGISAGVAWAGAAAPAKMPAKPKPAIHSVGHPCPFADSTGTGL
jgi:hypothetical protein